MATNAIFIGGGELEKVMGHFYGNRVVPATIDGWIPSIVAYASRLGGLSGLPQGEGWRIRN